MSNIIVSLFSSLVYNITNLIVKKNYFGFGNNYENLKALQKLMLNSF